MQSEYEITTLYQEAKTRWLKPPEVFFILQNHERCQLTHEAPHKPTSGSLLLFNKRILKFFRKDGHQWRKKKDGRAIAEAHERLKVGNTEALNCYYAHGELDPAFQRRIYWILDQKYDHIVLVHYRDLSEGKEGKKSSPHVFQSSPVPSTLFSSPSSIGTQNASYNHYIGDSTIIYPHSSTSLGYAESLNSEIVFKTNGVETPDCGTSSSDVEVRKALKRLEEQLSIEDDNTNAVDPFYIQKESLDILQFLDFSKDIDHLAQPANVHQNHSNNLMLVNNDSGGKGVCDDQESESWKDVLEAINYEGITPNSSNGLLSGLHEDPNCSSSNQGGQATLLSPQELGSFEVPACYSSLGNPENNVHYSSMMNDEGKIGIPLEQEMRLIDAHKQKFTIQDISPEWGYANETTKVIIVGSFLCDPRESTWCCMFESVEVPFEIIKEGVIRCEAPPLGPGKVKLCITSGDGISCSQIREFEYRDKPHTSYPRCSMQQTTYMSKSPDELLLLVKFVQTLLSDSKSNTELGIGKLLKKLKADDEEWSHLIEAIREGNAASSTTVDWLLQELLKDKLDVWLSSRSRDENQTPCSLSKQEQGVIHMAAGLGFEWALTLILDHGVSVDFRDKNGWSALHWAARFGSEKMVAALIASGASAGAMTDPSSQDPVGRTAASIASSNGHKGLAGYLSEVALTNHLASLTLEETEISKDCGQPQANITINSVSELSPDNEEVENSLAAVRNAAQAAAKIQAAFRAHSFRKRKQREAALAACLQEYGVYCKDIEEISAMMKLTFGNVRNYHSAALSIQKKYRGFKNRKDFLTLRQKVVKIQAHVRGYQTRKLYKVICWAVGVLDKAVLRWRRKGAGLRGFRNDVESREDDEDEDILKVFRKQKVDGAVNGAFSRVLSMAKSPEARQQYTRVLKRYCQRKAELGKTETLRSGEGDGDGDGDGDDDDALFDIANMEEDNLFSLL